MNIQEAGQLARSKSRLHYETVIFFTTLSILRQRIDQFQESVEDTAPKPRTFIHTASRIQAHNTRVHVA